MSKLANFKCLLLPREYRSTPLAIQKNNIWSLVYLKIFLAIYRPLGILRKKIDKSTCKIFTFGHRSERVQTPRNIFYFFLSVEFYCGHFKPIRDEQLSKVKILGKFWWNRPNRQRSTLIPLLRVDMRSTKINRHHIVW